MMIIMSYNSFMHQVFTIMQCRFTVFITGVPLNFKIHTTYSIISEFMQRNFELQVRRIYSISCLWQVKKLASEKFRIYIQILVWDKWKTEYKRGFGYFQFRRYSSQFRVPRHLNMYEVHRINEANCLSIDRRQMWDVALQIKCLRLYSFSPVCYI